MLSRFASFEARKRRAPATTSYVPACVRQAKDLAELSHGQPFGRQCRFLPAPEESELPQCCPASFFAPVEIFSEDPGQDSDHWQKVTGLKSESVTGIISDC